MDKVRQACITAQLRSAKIQFLRMALGSLVLVTLMWWLGKRDSWTLIGISTCSYSGPPGLVTTDYYTQIEHLAVTFNANIRVLQNSRVDPTTNKRGAN